MARSRTQHEYNISTLNKIFAVFAALMVVVVVGMVLDDYLRSWKQFQREFARMEREALMAEKATAEEDLNQDRLTKAEEGLEEAQTALQMIFLVHVGSLRRWPNRQRRRKVPNGAPGGSCAVLAVGYDSRRT